MKILTGLLTLFLLFGELTFSASEEWKCDEEGAVEAEISCPNENFLLKGMGTKSEFFLDAVAGSCNNMNEEMLTGDVKIYSFTWDESGFLTAGCPEWDLVIKKFSLCMKEDKVLAITLHCQTLKDPERIDYAVMMESYYLVDCGDNAVVREFELKELEDSQTTSVTIFCLKLKPEE